ncbi:pyridoxine 5'-phosphate synthase [Caballeronia sp. 15711]|uniref:pyridoxine 5'-phosphate synthase n=1 Tax=Caballeronia sp. 15711 TaxID=3391029 RepID=UPI0039E341A1
MTIRHDLNLQNLPRFLEIPSILGLSIGHALITECVELGVEQVSKRYLQIVKAS